ncbi:hypothetical protein J6590_001520 [Homalodisca vitripennis]|nr:hypothetical protein J6590_001520 [Homalodisca vitripennis]
MDNDVSLDVMSLRLVWLWSSQYAAVRTNRTLICAANNGQHRMRGPHHQSQSLRGTSRLHLAPSRFSRNVTGPHYQSQSLRGTSRLHLATSRFSTETCDRTTPPVTVIERDK